MFTRDNLNLGNNAKSKDRDHRRECYGVQKTLPFLAGEDTHLCAPETNSHATPNSSRPTYPGADASAAGGDLEVPVEVSDGAGGEEALHHEQDAVDEEGRRQAVDDVLEDVDPGERRPLYVHHALCLHRSAARSKLTVPLGWGLGSMYVHNAGWM